MWSTEIRDIISILLVAFEWFAVIVNLISKETTYVTPALCWHLQLKLPQLQKNLSNKNHSTIINSLISQIIFIPPLINTPIIKHKQLCKYYAIRQLFCFWNKCVCGVVVWVGVFDCKKAYPQLFFVNTFVQWSLVFIISIVKKKTKIWEFIHSTHTHISNSPKTLCEMQKMLGEMQLAHKPFTVRYF